MNISQELLSPGIGSLQNPAGCVNCVASFTPEPAKNGHENANMILNVFSQLLIPNKPPNLQLEIHRTQAQPAPNGFGRA